MGHYEALVKVQLSILSVTNGESLLEDSLVQGRSRCAVFSSIRMDISILEDALVHC